MMDENYHLKVIDFATAKIIGKVFNKKIMKFEDEVGDTSQENAKDDDKNIGEGDNYSDEDDDDDDEFRCKRGETFVGTAEYVSPEVLASQPSHFGSDIWTLGCMIYWMYNGKTPFKEKTEYWMFKRIKEDKVAYPETMPKDAIDLVQRILVREPEKRWGAGPEGNECDMNHLKNHSFFKGINFSNLSKIVPPHKDTFHEIKPKEQKQEPPKPKKESEVKPVVIPKLKNGKFQIWKEGILEKKSPYFYYNTRKITLDTSPKWDYSDPEGGQVKGVIMLDKDCKADYSDNSNFTVQTPKRIYKFKTNEQDEMLAWVRAINDAIRFYSE